MIFAKRMPDTRFLWSDPRMKRSSVVFFKMAVKRALELKTCLFAIHVKTFVSVEACCHRMGFFDGSF